MFQHELPSLKGSEEDCIANFVLQKNARISYPGACSLEFQSVMQILTECLLRWDTKTQTAKGKGILGTVIAFAGADEEQGRKTLHQHWQIWVKEINQTVRIPCFIKTPRQEPTHVKPSSNTLTMSYVQITDLIYASLTSVLTRMKMRY